jgi:hypothetical protein
MSNPDLPTDGNRLLTFEERIELRKKLLKMVFNTLLRMPIIGSCITSLILIGFGYVDPKTDAGKVIMQFFVYAFAISFIWLIVGVFKYANFKSKLPFIKD